jgi:APA family basic amino acid/polyamine antiporter
MLIYIGLAVLLVADFIYLAPETSGIGALIVLAGMPVYLVWSRLRRRGRPLDPGSATVSSNRAE